MRVVGAGVSHYLVIRLFYRILVLGCLKLIF